MILAAIFAGFAIVGLMIMTLMEDRVRGLPAAADKRLLRVFALAVLLALIAFYVWFRINLAPGAPL